MSEQHPEITAEPLFIVATLGPETGPFAPRSTEELEAWLDREATFWNFLRGGSSDYATNQMREKQYYAEPEIRELLARYKGNPTGHAEEIRAIGNRIANRYEGQLAIHSSSPRAAYIANLAKKDAALAAATAFSMIGNNPPHQDRVSFAGAALSAAYLHGLHTSPEDYSSKWSELLSHMQREREALAKAAGEANDEWNNQREKIATLFDRQKEVFESMLAKREIEFNTLMTAHTSKVDQVRDALKKDMSLKAAVTYFVEKASSHSTKVGWFTAAAIAVAGGVVWGAFAVAASVFKAAAQPSPVQIGLTVICGFLALWLLRLLVRILLSNLHLATDLRNRATLVQTYLALLADGGGGLSDKDRALIVGIVFRPVSDGLVRDDGAPPTVLTALQDLFSGSRK